MGSGSRPEDRGRWVRGSADDREALPTTLFSVEWFTYEPADENKTGYPAEMYHRVEYTDRGQAVAKYRAMEPDARAGRIHHLDLRIAERVDGRTMWKSDTLIGTADERKKMTKAEVKELQAKLTPLVDEFNDEPHGETYAEEAMF